MNPDHVLERLIPYRLQAIATFNYAVRLRCKYEAAQPMQIFIRGKLEIEGNSNTFINPAIEAGVIHCRALLEFLGLGLSGDGRLQNLQAERRNDDIGVEQFSCATGQLSRVTPEQAISRYDGGKAEAEKAFISIFRAANKGLAHVTSLLSAEEANFFEIASRGIPGLVVSYLYTPLGRQPPEYNLGRHLR